MQVTPAILLALVVSCGTMDPGHDPASLILETGLESFTGPADRPYNHSLDDPAGLASIKVEISEIDQARQAEGSQGRSATRNATVTVVEPG